MSRVVQDRPASAGSPTAPARRALSPRTPAPTRIKRKTGQAALRESEARYRAIAEAAQDFIFILDREGCVEYVNAFAARALGRQADDIVGQPISKLFPPEIAARQQRGIQRVLETGQPLQAEAIVPFPSGEAWLSTTLVPLRDPRGDVRAVLGISRDITERKRVETERARLAAIVENSDDAIVTRTLDGIITSWNRGAQRMFGYTAEETVGQPIGMLVPPGVPQLLVRNTDLVCSGHIVEPYESKRITKDGRLLDVLVGISPIKDSAGQVVGASGITYDISALKRAEQALKESEDRYRDLIDNLHDLICVHDLEGRILFANRASAKLLGYGPDELTKMNIRDVLAPEVRGEFAAYLAAIQRDSATSGLMRVQTRSGEQRIWEYRNTLGAAGTAVPIVRGIGRDITERWQAEKTLKQSEARYRSLVDNMQEGLGVQDKNGLITFVNRRGCEMLGYELEELLGKPIAFLFDEENQKILRDQMALRRAGVRQSYEIAWRRKDGGRVDTIVAPYPVFDKKGNWQGSVAVFTDITERKRAEDRLRYYAKRQRNLARRLMEAHEDECRAVSRELHDRIGQNLSALSLAIGMANAQIPADPAAAQKRLSDAQELLEMTTAQVRNVMADLRLAILEDYGLHPALVHLAAALSERAALPIRVSGTDINPRLPVAVETAFFRIAQEALNNGIKHAKAGTIDLTLRSIGERVSLVIADDGVGFDPVRVPSDHSHWGMTTMRERAEAVGATLRVESAPGRGTRVVVEIPPLTSLAPPFDKGGLGGFA